MVVGVAVMYQRAIPRPDRDARDYKATSAVVALLDARIASHGADGLPAWLSANVAGRNATDKAAVMLRVKAVLPEADWRAAIEVMR